jgi:hypothetical protein
MPSAFSISRGYAGSRLAGVECARIAKCFAGEALASERLTAEHKFTPGGRGLLRSDWITQEAASFGVDPTSSRPAATAQTAAVVSVTAPDRSEPNLRLQV